MYERIFEDFIKGAATVAILACVGSFALGYGFSLMIKK